jgi:prevent-host-death family protein
MRKATVTEAKNQLSALIDQVKTGESILILDRGIPVARLESAIPAIDDDGRIARLQRAGVVRAARDPGGVSEMLHTEPPRPRKGASVVAALLEERRAGR